MDRDLILKEALKCQDVLVSFAYGTLRDWDLAKDAVQDALVVLSGKYEQFDPQKSLFLWFKEMVRLKILEICRDRKHEVYVEDEELRTLVGDSLDGGVSEGDVQWYQDRLNALQRCMAGLSDALQELLVAYYWKHTTCEDLARAWNRRADSLRVALSRVRRDLRACMDRRIREAGEVAP